jgi:hypothetical protein
VYGSARWKPSRPRGHGARAPCEPRAVTETRSWHPGGGGRTGCGRQTPLADELAVVTRVSGRAVIRASLDGFHRPRSDRYARGRDSPEGYSTTRSISSASGRTCSSRSGRLDQAGTEARLSSTSGIGLSMGPGVGCRPGTCSSSMGNLPAAARAYRLLESTDLRGRQPSNHPRARDRADRHLGEPSAVITRHRRRYLPGQGPRSENRKPDSVRGHRRGERRSGQPHPLTRARRISQPPGLDLMPTGSRARRLLCAHRPGSLPR